LRCVQPDFFLFHKNPYIINKRDIRTAGQPDLIVEVWGEEDTKNNRDFKKYLYSASDITEHWYIEQDSNTIKCYLGRNELPDQSLMNILKTQNGLEFDLRYLAIK
jgi:Uma2 family endonuclease